MSRFAGFLLLLVALYSCTKDAQHTYKTAPPSPPQAIKECPIDLQGLGLTSCKDPFK